MTMGYKSFITFLDENINSDNELDMILYNIGTVQRIVEQFSQFYNQKLENTQEEYDDVLDLEIEFEMECNEKIHLALGMGEPTTLFVECEHCDYDVVPENFPSRIFIININKEYIAALTLESMRNEI